MNELIEKIQELSAALVADATQQAEKVTKLPVHVHVRLLWIWKKC